MKVRGKWTVVIALASAQFIMVLDSTVMNVSIQRVIDDLGTTVTEMQLAIATYTLTMAALMIVGGKIGDIIGRLRAFRIGLALFGLGAGITAAAPNIGVLIIGWSLVEAIGAALMIPAVLALVTGNYEGRDRAISFGIIGGIAGAGAACGPIIGGYVSTTWSWRDVFAGEVVVVMLLLAASTLIKDAPREGKAPKFDGVGALLVASGMALAVLGIVQSTDWGWIDPKQSPEIAGTAIQPFGFSIVPFLIVGGLALLTAFSAWERRLEAAGRDRLIDLRLLGIPQLRSGLLSTSSVMLGLGGTFFVLPLYLQIVLGFDPLETGVRMLPASVAVFCVSLGASRLSGRIAPRRIMRTGLTTIAVGALLLLATIEPELKAPEFLASLAVIGAGIGMVTSQMGNVNMSAVDPSDASQVGGLQGTAQNLGSALGTALIGSILLTSLTAGFDSRIESDSTVPPSITKTIESKTTAGLQFVPAKDVAPLLVKSGVPQTQADEIAGDYGDSQIQALKLGLAGVSVFALLGLLFATRGLPARPLANP